MVENALHLAIFLAKNIRVRKFKTLLYPVEVPSTAEA